MKKICLLSLAILCFQFGYSQEISGSQSNDLGDVDFVYEEPTKKHFTKEDRKFNSWYVSAFAGTSMIQSGDLVSWGDGWFNMGYDFQLAVTKELTHAVGLTLMGQFGKTRQYGEGAQIDVNGRWDGRTEYYAVSLMGDLNLSMLFRRVDNTSRMRWALHAYAGAGLLGYKAKRRMRGEGDPRNEWRQIDHVKLNDKSVFAQVGAGVRHKLSRRFDVELKGMYVMTGDERFDASGDPVPGKFTLADIQPKRYDNFVTVSLGVHFKIGKHPESLQWYPPTLGLGGSGDGTPCVDSDNDGVCDLYDKCPDTPEGIAVDGAGCPLDTDGDGVPDSIDECPTIPGPPTNNGCPKPIVEVSIGSIAQSLTDIIEGIEFDFDKATIRKVSYSKLDQAFYILQAHPDYKFYVIGHTDASGSVAYNQNLSERRADAVVRYLVNKGIPESQLISEGVGKSDLLYPECDPTSNCAPWKNLANRRVIFKPYGEGPKGLKYGL